MKNKICGIINNGVYVKCQKQTSFDAALKCLAVRWISIKNMQIKVDMWHKIFFVNVVRQLFYMHIRDEDDEQIGKIYYNIYAVDDIIKGK